MHSSTFTVTVLTLSAGAIAFPLLSGPPSSSSAVQARAQKKEQPVNIKNAVDTNLQFTLSEFEHENFGHFGHGKKDKRAQKKEQPVNIKNAVDTNLQFTLSEFEHENFGHFGHGKKDRRALEKRAAPKAEAPAPKKKEEVEEDRFKPINLKNSVDVEAFITLSEFENDSIKSGHKYKRSLKARDDKNKAKPINLKNNVAVDAFITLSEFENDSIKSGHKKTRKY